MKPEAPRRRLDARPTSGAAVVGNAMVTEVDTSPAEGAEARLLTAAAGGDRDAFMQLMAGHDDGLRVLAYRLLEDPDEMDDALQDVYAKAFIGLKGFRREAAIGTWLYRITYSTCVDRLRRRSREDAARTALADGQASSPDPVDAAGVRSDLARALASLPSGYRAAVLLVDRDGFDYEAAADILGVPVGTVASRLHRARAALRASLCPTRTEAVDDE